MPSSDQKLSSEALSNLVSFRETSYLKKLALELVARSLDPAQIRNLEKQFVKVKSFVELGLAPLVFGLVGFSASWLAFGWFDCSW